MYRQRWRWTLQLLFALKTFDLNQYCNFFVVNIFPYNPCSGWIVSLGAVTWSAGVGAFMFIIAILSTLYAIAVMVMLIRVCS